MWTDSEVVTYDRPCDIELGHWTQCPDTDIDSVRDIPEHCGDIRTGFRTIAGTCRYVESCDHLISIGTWCVDDIAKVVTEYSISSSGKCS